CHGIWYQHTSLLAIIKRRREIREGEADDEKVLSASVSVLNQLIYTREKIEMPTQRPWHPSSSFRPRKHSKRGREVVKARKENLP
ncbi:mCG144824, partial [Mus musculus]